MLRAWPIIWTRTRIVYKLPDFITELKNQAEAAIERLVAFHGATKASVEAACQVRTVPHAIDLGLPYRVAQTAVCVCTTQVALTKLQEYLDSSGLGSGGADGERVHARTCLLYM